MSNQVAFVASGEIPPSPPPANSVGVLGWLRANLFNGYINTLLTVFSLYLIYLVLPEFINWGVVHAVWTAESFKECRAIVAEQGHNGACWAVIYHRFDQFLYGFYPSDLYWRPQLAFVLLLVSLAYVLFDKLPGRRIGFLFASIYPVVGYFLIWGSDAIGLQEVESAKLGGFMLSTIIGVSGIAFSLPIGIALALGRQSNLMFLKTLSVIFIEFIRGVPLITLLFVANSVLSYFFPPGSSLDIILRVVIMVTLFASAYMAEVIRGGLAALPQGQYEAADALGLNYFKSMRLIILPQALKISIPNIVSTFIGLFKDTTLVVIIGLLDPIGLITNIRADSTWNGIVWEFYIFTGLFFFIFCFGMSRYSMYLERKLATDHR